MRVVKYSHLFEMIKIKELPIEMLPGGFVTNLPKECSVCGWDLEITEPLTEVMCRNMECKEKVYHRLKKMVDKMGLGIDDAALKEFIESRGITSPYGILAYNSRVDGEFIVGYGKEESDAITKSINMKRGMLLWEYMELGMIRGVEGNAEKIAGLHNNIHEFYRDIIEGGVRYIQEKLVTDTEGVYVNAVIAYNALITHKKELETYIKAVVIQEKVKSRGVYFAVDNMGMSREEVREYLMRETGRKYYIYETKDIINCDYIYKGTTNTVKETSILESMGTRETVGVAEIITDINEV